MPMKRGIIFAGGDFSLPADFKEITDNADFTVCADSGYDNAVRAAVVPDVIIGDMDSVGRSLPGNTEIIKLKCEKDDTDTEASIDYLIEKGCSEIVLLCALGGRLDHELANIMLTVYAAKRGAKLIVKSENTEILLIENHAEITGQKGDLLTLLPLLGDAEGVTLSGLKYPLEGATLHAGKTVGVSNEFVGGKAEVRLEKGLILTIKTKR